MSPEFDWNKIKIIKTSSFNKNIYGVNKLALKILPDICKEDDREWWTVRINDNFYRHPIETSQGK